MSSGADLPVGSRLLVQLAGSVTLSAVCIPAAVRAEHPELSVAATELGVRTTLTPGGDEDMVCELAHPALEGLRPTLRGFDQAPFVMLLAPSSGESATVVADTLLAGSAEWLAFDAPSPAVALLAPAELFLAAAALPGQWRAAPADSARLGSEQDTLLALWLAADRDRETLGAISDRIELGARRLDEARRARERMSAEVARLRESERHELDRMRLALLEQRAWVADQAMRLAASQSWRVGHRLVRIGRMLTLKRDRGTDLPTMIARRMEDGDFR